VDNNFVLQISNAVDNSGNPVNVDGQYLAVEFLQGLNSGEGASIAVAVPNEADATVFSLSSTGKLTYNAGNTIMTGAVFEGVTFSFIFFLPGNPNNEITCSLNAAESLTCSSPSSGDFNTSLTEFVFFFILGEYGLYMEHGPPANGATLTAIPV
jgi:hypothetical protein